MAGMANGPVPTKLTLLADLDAFSSGAKVRFLGCVMDYCTKTAVLTLEHNHPQNNAVRAWVDVGLLLNSLASSETRVGEWVNVMGYVALSQPQQSNLVGKRDIRIQAVSLWTAKAFDLASYERSLDEKKAIERTF